MTEDDDVRPEYNLPGPAEVNAAVNTEVSAGSEPPAGEPVPRLVPTAAQERQADTKRLAGLMDRAQILGGAQ